MRFFPDVPIRCAVLTPASADPAISGTDPVCTNLGFAPACLRSFPRFGPAHYHPSRPGLAASAAILLFETI
jgi:hypothetical protein